MALLRQIMVCVLFLSLISIASATSQTYNASSSASSDWTNPNNIFTDNGAYADTTAATKNYLYGKNYNVIYERTDAIINSVFVGLTDIRCDGACSSFVQVSVSWDGGTTYSTNETYTMTSTDTTIWLNFTNRTTWNPSKLTNANLIVKVVSDGAAPVIHLDYLPVRVNSSNHSVLNTTMDEGTGSFANDTSGFNNNGTITGAAWTTDSINGSALSFNDGTDVVTIPATTSLNASQITISTWVNLNQSVEWERFVEKQGQYNIGMWADTGKAITQIVTGSGTVSPSSPFVLSLNTWYYVTSRYDGSNVELYINNNLVSTSAQTGNILSTSNNLKLGGAGTTYNYNGTLDEVKIYNYALNATERTSDYQQFHPVLAYPTSNLTITATYPPQTTSVNFTWHDSEYPSDRIMVAKDSGFNVIVVDNHNSNDYYVATLESGITYYWKVQQYNDTAGSYGDISETETFTISQSSAATGTTIQGVVYELIGSARTPVSNAVVYIRNESATWSSQMIVGSNGYYIFENLANSTTYYVLAKKKDYQDSQTEYITTGNGTGATRDLLLKKTEPTYFEPDRAYVTFTVRNMLTGVTYSGVVVNAFEGDDATATFTGTTGSDGTVTFYMYKTQSYRITFVKASNSINSEETIIPGDEKDWTLPVWSFQANRDDSVSWNLSATDNDATTTNLNLTYTDTSGDTTLINFWVINGSNVSQILYSTSASASSLNAGYAVNDTVAASFIYGFNATRNGVIITENRAITFTGSNTLIDLKISSTYYPWISVIFLIGLSLLFSKRSNRYGYILIPLFALFFSLVGWFNVSYVVTASALVIGVIAYIRSAEKKSEVVY